MTPLTGGIIQTAYRPHRPFDLDIGPILH